MGVARGLLLMSIPVLLVSLILAPYPKLVLGTWLGRWVEIGQALAKIFVFMVCVDVTRVHPQFDTLEYVTSEMRAASSSLTTADARLEKVINLVDDYGWNRGFLINVGDVKGQVLDQALRARRRDPQPLQLAVELGTFVGYGTLRMARVLNGSSTLITVDPSVMSYAIASSLYEQAGVRDQITMKKDFSYNTFRELKLQGKKIDALFIDHVKKFYLSDLKLALQLDLLAQNCVVVADNILSPGAPDYKSFMFSEEGRQLFKTEVHQLHVEYMPTWPDEVLVSTFLGAS